MSTGENEDGYTPMEVLVSIAVVSLIILILVMINASKIPQSRDADSHDSGSTVLDYRYAPDGAAVPLRGGDDHRKP